MKIATPKFATMKVWTQLSGMSERTSFHYLGTGHLQARKVGKITLIDVDAGLAWIRSQPAAKIKPRQDVKPGQPRAGETVHGGSGMLTAA